MANSADSIRADSDNSYYLRFVLIGLGALAYGMWSFYDAAIGYPNQRQRVAQFEEFQESETFEEWRSIKREFERGTRDGDWAAYAQEQGWPLEDPGEAKSDIDIYFNYGAGIVCALVGLPMLVWVAMSRSRWIAADRQSITTSWGQTVPFDTVTSINKSKWKNKGIAVVKYDDGGRPRRFVVDDFKFKREPTDEILRRLEDNVSHDVIVGGPPEAAEDEAQQVADEPLEESRAE